MADTGHLGFWFRNLRHKGTLTAFLKPEQKCPPPLVMMKILKNVNKSLEFIPFMIRVKFMVYGFQEYSIAVHIKFAVRY